MYKNAKNNCLCNSEHICQRTIVHHFCKYASQGEGSKKAQTKLNCFNSPHLKLGINLNE